MKIFKLTIESHKDVVREVRSHFLHPFFEDLPGTKKEEFFKTRNAAQKRKNECLKAEKTIGLSFTGIQMQITEITVND